MGIIPIFMKKPKVETYLVPVLRPIVRFCLKHSFYLQDIVEILKRLLLEEASLLLEAEGQKVNVSRVSALTGMHRKDIPRLQSGEVPLEEKNLVSRVLGQWQFDRRFSLKDGKPKVLKLDTSANSFKDLVASVSSDLNSGTLLFELERLGLIKKRGSVVRLLKGHHSVQGNTKDALIILSADINDLLNSVDTNLAAKESIHLHGRTEFDNVDPKAVPKIRNWLIKEGREFHQRAREYLSKYDRDILGKPSGEPGARVAVGTFSFDEING